MCGHGHFDMKAYEDYLAGRLQFYKHPKEEIAKSIGRLRELYPWIDQLPY